MPEPQAALLQAVYGAQTAQMLYVAAKLGIADQLQHRHDTAAALAHTLGVNASALQRILRGLVSLGVCAENAEGQFSLTSVGAYLRSDHPDSLQPRLLLNGEVHYALWTEVLATVRGPARRLVNAALAYHSTIIWRATRPWVRCSIGPWPARSATGTSQLWRPMSLASSGRLSM
jgi:hypothetical protein